MYVRTLYCAYSYVEKKTLQICGRERQLSHVCLLERVWQTLSLTIRTYTYVDCKCASSESSALNLYPGNCQATTASAKLSRMHLVDLVHHTCKKFGKWK